MNSRTVRAAFVYAHPGPTLTRRRLLPSIQGEFIPAYAGFTSTQAARTSSIRRFAELAGYAVRFPKRTNWDLLIGDGPQHLPVLMKKMGLLRRDQKIVPYLAGEFNYFLATGFYGPTKTKLLRRVFQEWDGYLCVGEMTADLVRQVVPPYRYGDIFTFHNFIRQEQKQGLEEISPDLANTRMLFIGNGNSGFRIHYKGIDLLHQAHTIAAQQLPALECTIVGRWDKEVQEKFGASVSQVRDRVTWAGHQTNLSGFFSTHGLYIHCARGEAWGLTVNEAMLAGVPPIVSEWTGAKEAVRKVDPRLIVPLDPQVIAERILWYFGLPLQERIEMGKRAREVILLDYTEAKAIDTFRLRVREMLDHFGMNALELPAL